MTMNVENVQELWTYLRTMTRKRNKWGGRSHVSHILCEHKLVPDAEQIMAVMETEVRLNPHVTTISNHRKTNTSRGAGLCPNVGYSN